MKKMIGRAILLLMLSGGMLAGLLLLSADENYSAYIADITDSKAYVNVGSDEVLPRVAQVRKEDGATRLILGDSVANQIFYPLADSNEEYCIATSNRALTAAGQYILAEQFLENHPAATDVYLGIIIDTLETEIDKTYGYQYVVIPFTQTDTISLLDEATIRQMEGTFGKLFMNKWMVNKIDASGLNRKLYLNWLGKRKVFGKEHEEQYQYLSEVAVTYILKIKEMCDSRGVNFHLFPCPLAGTEENRSRAERMEKEFMECGLVEIAPRYFEEIIFYPEEAFRDGVHFTEEFATPGKKNEIIGKIQENTDGMENLVKYEE